MSLKRIGDCLTYVINLDRRIDRWNSFLKQPTLSHFSDLHRFSAVDGSKLDIFSDERISLHTKQNIFKNYRRSHYEICTPGAIGASFSHISLWKKLLESDKNFMVVFEDDVVVGEEDLKKIYSLISTLPSDRWDMWLLGSHIDTVRSEPLDPLHKNNWWKVTEFTGAHAYILTKRGAEILLENPFPIETHIEYYISACSQLKGLKIIKHPTLRMINFQELTKDDDSDTFNGMKTCPVCYIPDNYVSVGVYTPYWKILISIAIFVILLYCIYFFRKYNLR